MNLSDRFEWGLEGKVAMLLLFGMMALMVSPDVLAQAAGGDADKFKGACENVVGFFTNFEKLLKAASVIIVTIAIVFAGYQIAFAHKRLTDVAPILIGGLLIGGAAAIAGWFTASWAGTTTC